VLSIEAFKSGATAYPIGSRGRTTFKSIVAFQHPRSRLRPPTCIVELAVLGGVPDIALHTVKVERCQGTHLLETLYSRPVAHPEQADLERLMPQDAYGPSVTDEGDAAAGRAATNTAGPP
jgi:hypothetical protein